MLYGSEIWALRTKDMRKLSVIELRSPDSICGMWRNNLVGTWESRLVVQSFEKVTRFKYVKVVVRCFALPIERLPRCMLSSGTDTGWKIVLCYGESYENFTQ